ncbi:MAG TPA: DUF3570 domain-containing protein [Kofleriaceae bacterium]|jgi:hypothetical protein
MRLQLTLLVVIGQVGVAHADDPYTLSFDTLVYSDTDNVLVVSPQVAAKRALDDGGGEASARAVVDVISAASVDVVSQATSGFTEVRREADLAASHRIGSLLPGLRYRYSDEPDYRSHGFGGSLSRDFADHDTTIALGYDLSLDTVGRSGTSFADWSRDLATHTAELSWTQVLGPRTVGRLAYSLVVQDGYLEKPYRYVPLFDAGTLASLEADGMTLDGDNFSSYRLPERPPEEVPDRRVRHAIALRGVRYVPGLGALQGDYRLYVDSWGMQAHTVDATLRLPVGRFRIDVEDRFHWQSPVDFWRRAYVVDGAGEVPRWRTVDRDLGGYLQDTVLVRGQLDVSSLEIYLQTGAMVTRFNDYLFLDWRLALIAETGLRWRF